MRFGYFQPVRQVVQPLQVGKILLDDGDGSLHQGRNCFLPRFLFRKGPQAHQQGIAVGGGQSPVHRRMLRIHHRQGKGCFPHHAAASGKVGGALCKAFPKKPFRQLPPEKDGHYRTVRDRLEGVAAGSLQNDGLAGCKKGILIVGSNGALASCRPDDGILPLPGAAPNAVPGCKGTDLGGNQGQQAPGQVVGDGRADLLGLVLTGWHGQDLRTKNRGCAGRKGTPAPAGGAQIAQPDFAGRGVRFSQTRAEKSWEQSDTDGSGAGCCCQWAMACSVSLSKRCSLSVVKRRAPVSPSRPG